MRTILASRTGQLCSIEFTQLQSGLLLPAIDTGCFWPPLKIYGKHRLGKGAKKNKEKKLTSVSFAFTHTYTAVKTNSFRFFPQAYMENFEKCAKTQKLKQKIFLSHVTFGR